MEQPVILSKLEQEYVLRAIESSLQVRDARQLFLWAQGQLQALLPHAMMVCMQFDEHERLLRIEALHASVLGAAALERLCHADTGLAPRIARQCAARQQLPCLGEAGGIALQAPLAAFQRELDACGYDNILVHGTGRLPGGASVFALFGLPQRPGPRQAYFLELLLPQLHLALLRTAGQGAPPRQAPGARGAAPRTLSGREIEILLWLREGKSNAEIGAILGLSALTVKNHLQRVYRTLDVVNRTQAVARSGALRLLPDGPPALPDSRSRHHGAPL